MDITTDRPEDATELQSAYKPLQEAIGLRGRGKYPEGPRRPPELTQELLQETLDYIPETGELTWRVNKGPRARVGMRAGSVNGRGYCQVLLYGKHYLVHRLAWLYVHGRWPADKVDHIDGNPSNNKLSNLRECTQLENQQNRAPQKQKRSGLPHGVTMSHGKYGAKITTDGKPKWLGTFETQELAHAAYLAAKAELHTFQPIPRE
ncbi:P56 [Xanthomonas phage phiL7]|uniref:p56 n=1 Tax=Xanthomonas phage phiL7 TaxID=538979 RepID=C4ML56_9CAUD|nr:HNH endonuclease [Xanthomonas phage phiL7]ACE75796.1 P56 [Xanthomonas phage phiL7]